MKTKAVLNENKKRIEEIKNQTVEITVDGIVFTFRKRCLLYVLSIGKAPMKITNSIQSATTKDPESFQKASDALAEMYDILRDLIIDPCLDDLNELFEVWDTKNVLDLFNSYCYGANSGKPKVDAKEIMQEVEEQAEASKNS